MLLLVVALIAADAPRVVVTGGDAPMRGFVALALVDDGCVVVPSEETATHALAIAQDPDGTLLTVSGATERSSRLAHGPTGLVELEVARRASALVSSVDARPPRAAPDAAPIALSFTTREVAREAFDERIAAALLDRGVSLSASAREQLCLDLGARELVIAWGRQCEGRPVAIARATAVPSAVVGEALRLRDAAPLERTATGAVEVPEPIVSPRASRAPAPIESPLTPPATPATPPATPPATTPSPANSSATSASTPTSPTPPRTTPPLTTPAIAASVLDRRPLVLALRGGVMTRALAPDPIGNLSLAWHVWRGLGPTLRVTGSGSQPTKLLTIAEAAPMLGAAARFDLGDFSLRGELLGGALLHAFTVSGEPTLTIRPDVALTVGGGGTWWFLAARWARLGLDLDAALGGELRTTRIHTIGGFEVWRRDPILLTFSVGLTLDILTVPPDVENSTVLARGDSVGDPNVVDRSSREGAAHP